MKKEESWDEINKITDDLQESINENHENLCNKIDEQRIHTQKNVDIEVNKTLNSKL